MGDTTFDSAVATAKISIAGATPEQVMFICRETFMGIAKLLEPVLEDLKNLPIKSVEDAEASLTKIHAEYWKLTQKGGIDQNFEDEIKEILPYLQEARSQISIAVTIRKDPNLNKDKFEYLKYLPLYHMAILKSHEQVGSIIKYIHGLDDIVLVNTGKDKRDTIDST